MGTRGSEFRCYTECNRHRRNPSELICQSFLDLPPPLLSSISVLNIFLLLIFHVIVSIRSLLCFLLCLVGLYVLSRYLFLLSLFLYPLVHSSLISQFLFLFLLTGLFFFFLVCAYMQDFASSSLVLPCSPYVYLGLLGLCLLYSALVLLSLFVQLLFWPPRPFLNSFLPVLSFLLVTLCATPYQNSDLYFPSSLFLQRPLLHFHYFSILNFNLNPLIRLQNSVCLTLTVLPISYPFPIPIHPDQRFCNPVLDLLIPPSLHSHPCTAPSSYKSKPPMYSRVSSNID